MYFTAKKGKSNKNLVVIRAPIRNMGNQWIFGVKFCQSYGVVEKDSKIYYQVTRSPLFKGFKELPLEFLSKVFRSKDIEIIFGRDIFLHFLDAANLTSSQVKNRIGDNGVFIRPNPKPEAPVLEEIMEQDETAVEASKCGYIKTDGTVCNNTSSPASPAGYCFGHLRYDESRKNTKNLE